MTTGIWKMNDKTSQTSVIASLGDRHLSGIGSRGGTPNGQARRCGKREKPVGLEQQHSGSLALCPSPSHPRGSRPDDEPLWLHRISFHHSLLRTCSWCLIPRYSPGALHLQCLYLGSVTHCQTLECFTTSYSVYTLQ